MVTATSLAVELALAGSRCGKHKSKKPPLPDICDFNPNSFTGDTVVFTDRGLKAIADVAVGDKVAAWNPETGRHDWKPVTERSERTTKSGLVKLTLKDRSGRFETLSTTANHPFLRALEAANDNRSKAKMVVSRIFRTLILAERRPARAQAVALVVW